MTSRSGQPCRHVGKSSPAARLTAIGWCNNSNSDMRDDRFLRLQLAGDLFSDPEPDLFVKLAGLGFQGLVPNTFALRTEGRYQLPVPDRRVIDPEAMAAEESTDSVRSQETTFVRKLPDHLLFWRHLEHNAVDSRADERVAVRQALSA